MAVHRRKKLVPSLPCGPCEAEKEIFKLGFEDRIKSLDREGGQSLQSEQTVNA